MGIVLVKEPLIFRRAGAIGLRIAPAIEKIAALAVMAARVTWPPRPLSCCDR